MPGANTRVSITYFVLILTYTYFSQVSSAHNESSNRLGADPRFGHDKDEEIVVFQPFATEPEIKFVNVDTTSQKGLLRAAELGLVASGKADMIFTSDINFAADREVILQSKNNKKTEKLIDQFASGDKNQYTIKAAYIIRDTIKAIGTNEIKPATFGIFYDDLENPMTGGTGHTMKVCEQNNIPIINQEVWFKWLQE